jgi:hypothetical protein
MKKIITGIMLAIPLAMTLLPTSASAIEIVVKPQRHNRQVVVERQFRNRRPVQVVNTRRRVWVPAHWEQQGRRRVRVPGHYVWRN